MNTKQEIIKKWNLINKNIEYLQPLKLYDGVKIEELKSAYKDNTFLNDKNSGISLLAVLLDCSSNSEYPNIFHYLKIERIYKTAYNHYVNNLLKELKIFILENLIPAEIINKIVEESKDRIIKLKIKSINIEYHYKIVDGKSLEEYYLNGNVFYRCCWKEDGYIRVLF